MHACSFSMSPAHWKRKEGKVLQGQQRRQKATATLLAGEREREREGKKKINNRKMAAAARNSKVNKII